MPKAFHTRSISGDLTWTTTGHGGARCCRTRSASCYKKPETNLPAVIRGKYLVGFDTDRVKLLPQHLISLDGIATDLLVHVRRHAREIRDVRLKSRLAVADRLSQQFRCKRTDSRIVGRLALSFPDARHELIDAAHELTHSHVVLKLLLQIRNCDAISSDSRIDQHVDCLRLIHTAGF